MDAPNAVSIAGLSHWFGTGDARKQALYDIDVAIARGSLTALVGASGSGKTTLLTLVGCLRAVQQGSLVLLGHELAGASGEALVAHRRRLGFIFQAHNLHASLTARQNVRMGLELHGLAAAMRDEAVDHVLDLVGLADRRDYLPDNLSGGQKQRVAVARALVGNPEIVLADEPTAALDRTSALNVVGLLKRLGAMRGTTTLLVTHDPRIVDLADRVLTLEDGHLAGDAKGDSALA
jgi:putative ABC transport system ATP-binding protein